MELSDNLSQAFEFSIKLTKDVGNLIILVILNIIPIVNFIVWGYAARILREGPEEPPKLDRYGEAFIEGLKIAIATLIYFIIPALLGGLIIGFGMLSNPAFWSGAITQAMVLSHLWTGIAFALFIGFFFAIIATMGIINMIKTKEFGKAFAFSEILRLIEAVGWGKYIIWLIVMFVLGIIVSSFSNIPFIGWIISSIINVFFIVFFARSAYLLYPEERTMMVQETGS
jgi:hypothetical protein